MRWEAVGIQKYKESVRVVHIKGITVRSELEELSDVISELSSWL